LGSVYSPAALAFDGSPPSLRARALYFSCMLTPVSYIGAGSVAAGLAAPAALFVFTNTVGPLLAEKLPVLRAALAAIALPSIGPSNGLSPPAFSKPFVVVIWRLFRAALRCIAETAFLAQLGEA
jgi:hypothetical protein